MRFPLLAAARRAEFLTWSARNNSALRAAAKRGIVVAAFLCMTAPIHACPMCKDSTINTDTKTVSTDSAGLDFNKSIYVMLGGLVSVVGFTGRAMFKAAKSSR